MDFCIKYRFINRHDGLTKNLCEGRGILRLIGTNRYFLHSKSFQNLVKYFASAQGKRVQKTQIAQQTKLTP